MAVASLTKQRPPLQMSPLANRLPHNRHVCSHVVTQAGGYDPNLRRIE